MTTRRLSELAVRSVKGQFDSRHLQAIHRYIFQDVYPWAGEFRTVNISRAGQFPFAFAEHIAASLDKLASGLARERHLHDLALSDLPARRPLHG